ncbi:MAG: hypothetical protein Q9159_000160 [Coniocarpon cinnabarinum]
MKTEFSFQNLLGSVYRKGNILFTPDGTCLLSPVGNRVTVFDLTKNVSYTLPLAHRRNISRLALNPQGNLFLTVDQSGRAILSHFTRRIVLHHLTFKHKVSAISFSPSGRHFAVGVGRFVEVWHTPGTPDVNADGVLEFAPFVRHHRHAGHSDTVQSIEWSSDSRFFLTASKDLTARIWSLDPVEGFQPTVLAGHRQAVRAAWFSKDQEIIYTISKDGALFEWKYTGKPLEEDVDRIVEDETDQRWRVVERHYFMQNDSGLTCATYHAPSGLLVSGFSTGVFTIHELPSFSLIHTLSISQSHISHVTINKTGEWLAFGSSAHGQLLVWEWQSESYILKQQGHFDSTNAIAYSPDGSRIVTASDDGKLKLWDVASGFCIVTFTEHTGSITACEFAKRGNVLFTASLDGSVRAWDLIRYRNFRTFTGKTRLSFSSLAVDPSGEVFCAGSTDSFDIIVWSVQTGQLLDELAGHEGPVASLAFAPNGSALASASWDHTVRLWDIFARTQTSEPLQLQADVLAVQFRPDSQELAVAALDGSLTFWNVANATQAGTLDARRDVSGGRKISDRRTAASSAGTKHFTTVAYSPDGSVVLAAGNSKHICMYAPASGVLLKKYIVSVNIDVDGTQDYLNSRNLTEAGPAGLISDTDAEASDRDAAAMRRREKDRLPGSMRGIGGDRTTRPSVRVPSLAFAPTGRSFCAASTEGLLVYSVDSSIAFDPIDLDIDVTPEAVLTLLKMGPQKDVLTALLMAFRLNNPKLVAHVYTSTSLDEITFVARSLPKAYLPALLRQTAVSLDSTPHLEFNLKWIEALMRLRGREIKEESGAWASELRLLQRAVRRVQAELSRLADENGHTLDFLLNNTSRSSADDQLTIQQVMDDRPKLLEDNDRNAETIDDLLAPQHNDRNVEREVVAQGDDDGWLGLED